MNNAQIIEADFDEITKEMGNVPIAMFPFRLSTDKNHYINEVVKYAVKQMASISNFRIDLLFVRGVPERMCRSISNKIVKRLGSLPISGTENIHIHGQGNVDVDLLDKLGRDFRVIRL